MEVVSGVPPAMDTDKQARSIIHSTLDATRASFMFLAVAQAGPVYGPLVSPECITLPPLSIRLSLTPTDHPTLKRLHSFAFLKR